VAKITNIRTVSVPSIGKLPLAEKPGTFTPGGIKREHKAGRLAEDGGYTETSIAAKLELNLNLLAGLDVMALNTIENEDITIRLADGSVHLMSQAFTLEPIPIGDDDGKITFMSNASEKIA